MVSAWVPYALAAAAVNPQDQARVGGVDAFSYLSAHTGALEATTDWERALLVAVASCTAPDDFGGTDPVARLLERQLPDGSFPHDPSGRSGGINDTAFAILALSSYDEPAIRAAIPKAADWLLTAQFENGSWGWSSNPGSESTDMTGAVIQALRAAGRGGSEAEQRAFAYLRGLQLDDGGFPQIARAEGSNVASTAWSVQAMWASGVDPRGWAPAGQDPLDYLAARQQLDGSIQYRAGQSLNDLWMTAEVAPAFAGHSIPVPCVPRSTPESTSTSTATATPTGTPRRRGVAARAARARRSRAHRRPRHRRAAADRAARDSFRLFPYNMPFSPFYALADFDLAVQRLSRPHRILCPRQPCDRPHGHADPARAGPRGARPR